MVSCASKVAASSGRPTKRRRRACARAAGAPAATSRHAPARRRRAFDLATAAAPARPAPAARQSSAAPGAVLGTRGRGHLPASTAPPAAACLSASQRGAPPTGRRQTAAAIKIRARHRAACEGHSSAGPRHQTSPSTRPSPTARSPSGWSARPRARRRSRGPARLDRGARITSRERRPRARRGDPPSPVSTTGRSHAPRCFWARRRRRPGRFFLA